MVVTDTQTTRGISGSGSGPVTESKNPADILAAKRLHDRVSSHFRRFERHGDGLIAPGIFELMAAIGDVNKLHGELVCGILKTARLIAEFRGEEQQAIGWLSHSWCVSMPGSNKAIGACDRIFHQRLLGADGDELVPGRLGTAIPGFAEEGDASPGVRR